MSGSHDMVSPDREARAGLEPHAGAIDRAFADTVRLHQEVLAGSREAILAAAAAMAARLQAGGKVLVCGNGGSAADAQHFAAELVGRFVRERRALAAVALTVDTSILTAVANDYGYERVFARQVEALGRRGDALLAISTSGSSPNVVAALAAARQAGLVTVALTGRDGGALGREASVHINVPTESAARAQEVHATILHVICELLELAAAGA